MERTLIILKPDAVQRGIIGEVLSRFEKAGLKIIGMKMLSPSEDHYHHHYESISGLVSRRGQEIFDRNLQAMMKGPVVAVVLEGVEAVEIVRKMVGDTNPKTAAPGTIRGDYSHMSMDHSNNQNSGLPNIIHASGDANEAKQEIEHWFKKDELFEYKTAHEHFTQKS